MSQILRIAAGCAALGLLSACLDTTGGEMASQMPASPAGPPFITTFDSAVSNAAVNACRNALAAQTTGGVSVVGTEFSQAAVAVYMRVGANGAPWRCLTSNDGSGTDLMFMGSEGAA